MTSKTQTPTPTTAHTAHARESLARLSPADPVKVATGPAEPGVLRSDRLVLRPLCEHDRQAFITLMQQSRAHLERFSPLHMPDESDDALFARQLALTQAGEASGKACRRIACTRSDQESRIIGAFNINAIRRGLSVEGDANWWLGAHATGQGYATEGLLLLLAYAFADMPEGLGLHRVLAGIQKENAASRTLAARVGFVGLGDEKTYLHAGDKWDLHEMFAVTPESMETAISLAQSA